MALLATTLGAAAPARAPAQAGTKEPEPWVYHIIAYPAYDALDGFSGGLVTGWRKAARPGPIPTTSGIEITGRIAASGSRSGQLAFDYPGLWPGWRMLVMVGADRLQRAPYFGLGNTPVGDTADAIRYFRYSLLRYTAAGVVQRNLAKHVRLHLGAQGRRYWARPLTGDTTLLLRDLITGTVTDTGAQNSVELRAGLLYDTRDEEATPSRGLFLEALAGRGVADLTYTRYALGARAFIPLGEMTVLGVRQSVELADRAIPFYVMYERFTSWRPEDGFGGNTSLRVTVPGRFLAPNRAITSVDLRYKKLDVPLPTSPFRLWFVAFADAGRLWMNSETPDLHGLHWDVGGAALLQFSKGTLFGLNVGVSRVDGFEFGSTFTFGF